MSPSTSATRPIAPRVGVGQRVSSTVTISPGDAPPSWPGGTRRPSARGGRTARRSPCRSSSRSKRPTSDALRALEDADDAAFGAAAVLDALDAHDDAVAVHRLVQVRRRRCRCRRRASSGRSGVDEAVAGRVRLQPADVQIHLLGQAEAVAADLDQLARRDERLEVPLERRRARRAGLLRTCSSSRMPAGWCTRSRISART